MLNSDKNSTKLMTNAQPISKTFLNRLPQLNLVSSKLPLNQSKKKETSWSSTSRMITVHSRSNSSMSSTAPEMSTSRSNQLNTDSKETQTRSIDILEREPTGTTNINTPSELPLTVKWTRRLLKSTSLNSINTFTNSLKIWPNLSIKLNLVWLTKLELLLPRSNLTWPQNKPSQKSQLMPTVEDSHLDQ